MPIATPETYQAMLDAAGRAAMRSRPSTSPRRRPLNAALKGFAEAESDGIIQISTGGAEFLSGLAVKEMPVGARALAEFAHVVAERYPINIALHTDHCQPDKVDTYIRPLLAVALNAKRTGKGPLFQSHMLDASELPLDDNLALASELLDECAAVDVILELEIGIVGGVEDTEDHEGIDKAKLYTSPDDMVAVGRAPRDRRTGPLSSRRRVRQRARGLQTRAVELRPTILRDGQSAMEERFGEERAATTSCSTVAPVRPSTRFARRSATGS